MGHFYTGHRTSPASPPNHRRRSGHCLGMRKPSPTTVIALIALFVALGGPATAAKLISGKKLKNNSVTSAKIRNRTLTSDDISRGTLRSLKRTASNVTSANIVDGTIQLADMGASSVTGNQV